MRTERNENSRIVATYDYSDENGNLLYQVVRYAPKDFKQRRPNDQLILALLQHPTIERAAASAGVSESTLRRRMRNPGPFAKFRRSNALCRTRRPVFVIARVRFSGTVGPVAG